MIVDLLIYRYKREVLCLLGLVGGQFESEGFQAHPVQGMVKKVHAAHE